MSIVALADGASSVTRETLHDVAAKSNIKINPVDEDAYLLVLQSADATAANIDALPDYTDPRLSIIDTVGGRHYTKPTTNSINAWSQHAGLIASSPTSSLLKGKRIGIKDNISVGAFPYTCGMLPSTHKSGAYPLSTIDATVTRRALLAGGTITGITTCENYSLTPLSYTSANGPVHNPWLQGYNTGGSTSGGAALLALRAARAAGVPGLDSAGPDIDIAIGGDQAGSIRSPSSYCGIYGLKPTHGLIPYTGIAGLHPMIDHTGPMAHTLEDIALALTALAGYDGLDPRMTPESPLPQNVPVYHSLLSSFNPTTSPPLRIGIITESLSSPGTDSTVASTVLNAAQKHFSAAGATVSQISLPMHLLAPAIWTAATRNYMASLTLAGRPPDVLNHNLPHFQPRWPPDQQYYDLLTHQNPAIINILFTQTLLEERYGSEVQGKAHRHVLQLRAAYDKALGEFDVLITPTTPTVAPPLPDMRPEIEGGASLMDKVKLAVGVTNNTNPFNVTGHPALNVPCGWSRAAPPTSSSDARAPRQGGWLPVGMQIIGKRWDEITVLKAAKVFEMGGGGLGTWPGLI